MTRERCTRPTRSTPSASAQRWRRRLRDELRTSLLRTAGGPTHPTMSATGFDARRWPSTATLPPPPPTSITAAQHALRLGELQLAEQLAQAALKERFKNLKGSYCCCKKTIY